MRVAPPHSRGWCPGLDRPMATGDGLLVRLHPPGGVLGAAALRHIAAAATSAGNGLIDVTGRGNLQIRGVRPEAHADLATALDAAGLGDPRPPGGPQRLTLAPPLAGLDPGASFDAFALAQAIEAGCRTLAGLHPKLLVTVEDGGRGGLGEIAADLTLRAEASGALLLGLAGGCGTWIVTRDPAQAVTAILGRLATLGPRRVRDLSPDERASLVPGLARADGAATLSPAEPSAPRGRPPLAPGPVDLGGGRFALAADLPFGRGTAALFARAAGWVEDHGDGILRLTPSRGLVVPGLDAAALRAVEQDARAAGLVLGPADPRRPVAACPGAPACASGHAPAQDDAGLVAAALAGQGASVHVSGCAKGCAHPGPADLTLVGAEGGYDVVLGGDARSTPRLRLPLADILARLAVAAGLAEAFPTRYGAPEGGAVIASSSIPAPPRRAGLRESA